MALLPAETWERDMNEEERNHIIRYVTGKTHKDDLNRTYWSPSIFPDEYKPDDEVVAKKRKPLVSKQLEYLETRVNVEVADIRKEVETLRVLLVESAMTDLERKELTALRSEVNALKSEIQALRTEVKQTGYLANALL